MFLTNNLRTIHNLLIYNNFKHVDRISYLYVKTSNINLTNNNNRLEFTISPFNKKTYRELKNKRLLYNLPPYGNFKQEEG